MGFERRHTAAIWSKAELVGKTLGYEDARVSAVGYSWAIQVTAWLVGQLGAALQLVGRAPSMQECIDEHPSSVQSEQLAINFFHISRACVHQVQGESPLPLSLTTLAHASKIEQIGVASTQRLANIAPALLPVI